MGRDGADLSRHWTLDPEITFLNHGSFGACPSPVLDAQRRVQLNPLRDVLCREHRIEVPLQLDPVGKTRLVRVSAQLYNTRDDYERLAAALLTLL